VAEPVREFGPASAEPCIEALQASSGTVWGGHAPGANRGAMIALGQPASIATSISCYVKARAARSPLLRRRSGNFGKRRVQDVSQLSSSETILREPPGQVLVLCPF